ncbi:hypothetical protein ACLOJK_023648 [Asimina triloba]
MGEELPGFVDSLREPLIMVGWGLDPDRGHRIMAVGSWIIDLGRWEELLPSDARREPPTAVSRSPPLGWVFGATMAAPCLRPDLRRTTIVLPRHRSAAASPSRPPGARQTTPGKKDGSLSPAFTRPPPGTTVRPVAAAMDLGKMEHRKFGAPRCTGVCAHALQKNAF